MDELLLQGENHIITEQLLNPNYYERKYATNEKSPTGVSEDESNLKNSANVNKQIATINAQPLELSTKVTPERWPEAIDYLTHIKKTTNFDDHNLTTTSSEDSNESEDHIIENLSMNIKNVGSNETLKQQLDFLQKNAENIKKQQHMVGENGVNILERAEYTDEDPTERVYALVSNINNNHENLTANVATNYNQKINQASSYSVLPRLPMPLMQPTDTNEEPANSYVIPVLKDTIITTKRGQQNESINPSVEPFYNDSLKLSKPPHQSNVKEVTNENHQAAMTLYDDRISEEQEYETHFITINKSSNYNNELVYGTTSYEALKLPQSAPKPSKRKQSPISDDATSLAGVSKEYLSQTSELMNIYEYNQPQQIAEVFLSEPSEPTISTSALSNTFKTVNIENGFKSLTEIFYEFSIPISNVMQQLMDRHEVSPENAILPTSSHEYENAQKTQTFTVSNERPDTIAEMLHDGTDSMEIGYGSNYAILQAQMNFTNFIRTKEIASDENSSKEYLFQEVLNGEEECNGMCVEDSKKDEAPPFSKLNQPTTNYQSNEYGESNESEHEENNKSATEYSNVNVVTTNPAATETKVSTTKVMTLFDATAMPFATYPIATIANEPANNLEHLEVAIENDVGKEIENIDKTNEMQVETIHQQQHSHFAANKELLAENTNDKSAWVATGLQHISHTLSAQPDKTTTVGSVMGERKGVPKSEVMCNKTEIIKSEQYSKTNENGNENEIENEKAEMISGGRVLLGRSLSYTISCHIGEHELPTTNATVVQAANTTDENNREKIIKNHEQLTITSADDSRNGLPVGPREPVVAEPIERRIEMDSTGDKANEGVADEGVGSADIHGNGYYGESNAGVDIAEDGMESGENYYIDEVVRAIDGDADADGDGDGGVDDYVTNAASLHVNGIQSRVRQAAAMTAVAQFTTSLETDNDKTYEYDTRQPLQGGLSDKDVNFQSVEHVAVSAVNSKNTKQMDSSEDGADKDYQDDDGYGDNDDDDDNDGNASIDTDEYVISDYKTENGRKHLEAVEAGDIGSVDREPNSTAVIVAADEIVGADDRLEYKRTKADAAAIEEQENIENYNAELLKTETESTKLKNASGGVSDANSDDSENNDDESKGESGDDGDSDDDEEIADVNDTAADAEAEDSTAAVAVSAAAADPMIAVADVTKPNGDDVKSAQSNASR
nr:serine-aspartate repeat-containing protein I-like [Bactrocera oleae]